MKIILLGTAWPYRGGLATFNERLARQFACEGHEVEVWTFTLQYPSFLKREKFAKGRAEIVEMLVPAGGRLDGMVLSDLYKLLRVHVLVCVSQSNAANGFANDERCNGLLAVSAGLLEQA